MSENLTCPYVTLNVSRDSSDEEIKKAYRRLAIQHHPDKNQGSVESTQLFQRISAAYAILSDPERKERYDRTGSLSEEDQESPDMDDLMQMFFTQFGGSGFTFGGNTMFFDVGGRGFRGGSAFYTDPFMEFVDGFGEEEMSDFDDSMDEYEMFMEEFLEVIPALFCSHFIEILEVAPATVPGKKSKQPKEAFKCTICATVMKSPEAAENHFINAHSVLVEKFCKVLEREGMDGDIPDLFEQFAEDVKSGKISEKAKSKKKNRGKKKKGPRVPTGTSTSQH
jgi:curved DNA-binding protein CbpA